jgi:hypothetical protein
MTTQPIAMDRKKKSRRAVGFLLAFLLVTPAPALTACEWGSVAAKGGSGIAKQRARDIAKRGGPAVGGGGVGVEACRQSEKCP